MLCGNDVKVMIVSANRAVVGERKMKGNVCFVAPYYVFKY